MSRIATIVVCNLPGFAEREKTDPQGAAQFAKRVNEVFSRNVYLNGGKIVDSEERLHVAEFELPDAAVKAAVSTKKGLSAPGGLDSIRLAINEGEIEDRDFAIAGKGLEIALVMIDAAGPNQIALPVRFTKGGLDGFTVGPSLGDIGGESFVALVELPVAKRAEPPVPPAPDVVETPRKAPGSLATEVKASRLPLIAIVMVAALALVLLAWFLTRGDEDSTVGRSSGDVARRASVDSGPLRLAISGEGAELTEDLVVIAELIRLMLAYETEIVLDPESRTRIELEEVSPSAVDDGPENAEQTDTAPLVRARLSGGVEGEGPLVDPSRPVVAASETVRWLADELGVSIVEYEIPDDEALTEALVAAVSDDSERNLRALASRLDKGPAYGPALTLLASRYGSTGETDLQIDALRRLAELRPGEDRIWRSVGSLLTERGRVGDAVAAWDQVLASDPGDPEALRFIALAALLVGDDGVIERVRVRYPELELHEADLADRKGDVSAAVRAFYQSESDQPDNLVTPFRVGRIGVMRRSQSVAALELEKLEKAEVQPEATFLAGYIAADAGNTTAAVAAIEEASRHADWSDSPHFHFAEIRSLTKDTAGTLREITMSVDRSEPKSGYIENDPLFQHLSSERAFRMAIAKLAQQQQIIRDSLSRLRGI